MKVIPMLYVFKGQKPRVCLNDDEDDEGEQLPLVKQ